jgi:hypothetical protein
VVPGHSWSRRLVSVAARCPGALARPVTRRLLMTAGLMVAGWLLGSAGQAHADTVPVARLPSVAAHTGAQVADVTDVSRHVPLVSRVVPAVPTTDITQVTGTVLRSSRPPAILALPPVAAPVKTGVPRPRRPADMGGPSRTRRHGVPGSHARASGGPLGHTGPLAVPGASEKDSTAHTVRSVAPVPVPLRTPQPLPNRALTPPPPSGGDGQPGLCRSGRPDAVCRRVLISTLLAGFVAPVIRTAADEPSFSPD